MERKKKILFVSHSGRMSGANLSFYSIIEQLKCKIDIYVLVNERDSELTRALEKISVKYIYLKYSWWVAHKRDRIIKQTYRYCADFLKYINSPTNNKIREVFANYGFDAVYSNTSTVDIGYRIANAMGIPHVWHIREFGREDFGFIPLVPRESMRRAFEEASAIIVISTALEKKILQQNPKSTVIVIQNGFNVDKLKYQREHMIDCNNVKILVTGQVSEAKGQIQAVEAISKLNSQNVRYHLYLAGEVGSDYRKQILGAKPCPEWLHFMGKVNNLFEIRKDIDIELVCSRSEAFGRVTIEAMLHSIPVIGANTGATKDLLANGLGITYTYGDIEDLIAKIECLVHDRRLYNDIALKAFNYAQNFTIDKCADSVYNILVDACKKSCDII